MLGAVIHDIFLEKAFSDKHIIICGGGGAGDIGAEIATTFAKTSASRIALIDKDAKGLSEVARSLEKTGCTAVECEVDLTDEDSIVKGS